MVSYRFKGQGLYTYENRNENFVGSNEKHGGAWVSEWGKVNYTMDIYFCTQELTIGLCL